MTQEEDKHKENIYGRILRYLGWKVEVSTPDIDKSIICVAPHTSNWDFILCELAIRSIRRKSGFLMKSTWFFFPLGNLFRAMGGIAVVRKPGGNSLVDTVIEMFRTHEKLTIAITPEGTRKRVETWHTGFLRIAYGANVPLQLAIVDFAKKEIKMNKVYNPMGDVEADLKTIKEYYRGVRGKHPEKFDI